MTSVVKLLKLLFLVKLLAIINCVKMEVCSMVTGFSKFLMREEIGGGGDGDHVI